MKAASKPLCFHNFIAYLDEVSDSKGILHLRCTSEHSFPLIFVLSKEEFGNMYLSFVEVISFLEGNINLEIVIEPK